MTILNFGSCCIDNVYAVPHFVAPGETLACISYEVHPGGKGLNQSLALARAGTTVVHAGRVGQNGEWLIELLRRNGVDTRHLTIDPGPSGHANIQVTPEGENAIVLFGGANREITEADIDRVLNTETETEYLLIQNEISCLKYLIDRAVNHDKKIVFNAAPMTRDVLDLPLASIHMLIINEIEGKALTGQEHPDSISGTLIARYPQLKVVLTLGAEGTLYEDAAQKFRCQALDVTVVDTTGAGDTFSGYFLAAYSQGQNIEKCLESATRAASICCTRPGAASSIPHHLELESKSLR